jgi:hypothetical protein
MILRTVFDAVTVSTAPIQQISLWNETHQLQPTSLGEDRFEGYVVSRYVRERERERLICLLCHCIAAVHW